MMHRFAHILLFSLAVCQYGAAESNLRTATTPSFASSQQHRDLSASGFWYTLLNLLHVPCPPNHTEEKPLGHCAHPSHKPKAPKKKSGGSSSSSSGGSSSSSSSSSGSSSNKCENGDESGCAQSSSSSWGGDSYETATSSTAAVAAGAWTGDSYTTSTVAASSSGSWSSGWTNSYSKATSEAQNSSSGNGKFWGIGIMCAALVGAIAFMVTKKRNQSAGEEKVPNDVYVEADGNQFARDGDEDCYANEDKSTSGSRVASIKTSLSRGFRSKFGKKNKDNEVGNYQAPV